MTEIESINHLETHIKQNRSLIKCALQNINLTPP